jgi:ABC-2 type transport system permease protein
MSKTLALSWRELRAYFYSPIAYVVMAVFLVLSGIFFANEDFVPGRTAEMRSFFNDMVYILVFVLPIVTMRLVSEEMSKGTIETLMTAPVTDTQVILGKFLGALAFFFLLLVPTAVYVVLLSIFASPDPGPIFSGYIGLLLVGALFISVGLLTSVCTKAQIVSAIISLIFLSVMTFFCYYFAYHAEGLIRKFMLYVGFIGRYQNFTRGTIPLNDAVYFISLAALALFLSVKVLESRKWRA